MDTDDANLINLTNEPADDNAPAWSPEGTKIAFESARGGGSDIFVMDADESSPTNLTEALGSTDTNPAWSPNGTKIAFSSQRIRGPDLVSDIFVMDVDGSNPTNLTADPESGDFEPTWSPDGTMIAFSRMFFRDGRPTTARDIFVINVPPAEND